MFESEYANCSSCGTAIKEIDGARIDDQVFCEACYNTGGTDEQDQS